LRYAYNARLFYDIALNKDCFPEDFSDPMRESAIQAYKAYA